MNRFIVPKSFDTHLGHSADAWQLGSQCHSPSTMNLNSWRPGGRSSFACQLPFLSFVIGSASVFSNHVGHYVSFRWRELMVPQQQPALSTTGRLVA